MLIIISILASWSVLPIIKVSSNRVRDSRKSSSSSEATSHKPRVFESIYDRLGSRNSLRNPKIKALDCREASRWLCRNPRGAVEINTAWRGAPTISGPPHCFRRRGESSFGFSETHCPGLKERIGNRHSSRTITASFLFRLYLPRSSLILHLARFASREKIAVSATTPASLTPIARKPWTLKGGGGQIFCRPTFPRGRRSVFCKRCGTRLYFRWLTTVADTGKGCSIRRRWLIMKRSRTFQSCCSSTLRESAGLLGRSGKKSRWRTGCSGSI